MNTAEVLSTLFTIEEVAEDLVLGRASFESLTEAINAYRVATGTIATLGGDA